MGCTNIAKKPKISVIITAYNSDEYIEDAIKSVLNQTFTDYEFIVVDDGSIDRTREIVLKYSDKLNYFYKNNGGHSDARNYGIKKAKGEFLAFLDSDDLWKPEKLEICYTTIIQNPHAGMVYSTFTLIDKTKKIIADKINLPKTTKHYPLILLGNFIASQGSLIKKECFETCGLFWKATDMYEDWHFFARIAKKYNIIYIKKPLFFYRATKTNKFSSDEINLRIKRQLIALRDLFDKDKNLTWFFKMRCISNVYFEMAKACFYRRQIVDTIRLNLSSIIYMPLQIKAYWFFLYVIARKVLNVKIFND